MRRRLRLRPRLPLPPPALHCIALGEGTRLGERLANAILDLLPLDPLHLDPLPLEILDELDPLPLDLLPLLPLELMQEVINTLTAATGATGESTGTRDWLSRWRSNLC